MSTVIRPIESTDNNLGNEDIKKDDGSYSRGLHNPFEFINEDNKILKDSYTDYKENKEFRD